MLSLVVCGNQEIYTLFGNNLNKRNFSSTLSSSQSNFCSHYIGTYNFISLLSHEIPFYTSLDLGFKGRKGTMKNFTIHIAKFT